MSETFSGADIWQASTAGDLWPVLLDIFCPLYPLRFPSSHVWEASVSTTQVSQPTDANAAKSCFSVASCSRGTKYCCCGCWNTDIIAIIIPPAHPHTVYSPVPSPLSSAIWLPERVRHHFCNGAAGICSRRRRLVLCSAGRQATAEGRMSHSGTRRNLKSLAQRRRRVAAEAAMGQEPFLRFGF